MGSVRTSILGRPRPLSAHRRAEPAYTLICEEPPNTFTYPRLCAAIANRLPFDGHIIEIGTSYRLAHTRARQATP